MKIKILDDSFYRRFGLMVALGFFCIGVIIPILLEESLNYRLVIVSGVLIMIALIYPALLRLPYQYWTWLGEKLGKINSTIILTFLYLSIFSLVHLIFLILRRDKMKSNWREYESTFQEKKTLSSFSDPF